MSEQSVHLCVVKTPEGEKHYFTVLPLDTVFSKGLIPEAIVGVLMRPLAAGESITPEVFARNSIFVKFMHDVIAKYAPLEPGFAAEAKRQGTGWIYILDRRTKTPQGAVPPEDIIGAFQAKDGKVVPETYQASPRHMILSPDGFFRLTPGLHEHLLRELQSRMNAA
ncbi:MAG: hypothetical protein QM770_13985 [Tepidisphaeraceae bacterium]